MTQTSSKNLNAFPILWLLFFFHVWSTLLGIFLIEWSYDTGYFSSRAYIEYAVVITISAMLFYFLGRTQIFKSVNAKEPTNISVKRILTISLVVQFLIALILITCFDGLSILLGETFRGVYRIQFGNLGFLLAILSKYCAPSLLTFATYLFFQNENLKKRPEVFLLIGLFILTFFIGLMMGGKTTAIRAVIGAIGIVIYRGISWKQTALLAAFLIISLVAGALVFDKQSGISNAAKYVAARMTTIQARAPWSIYRMHSQGKVFPPYGPMLISALGAPGVKLLTGAQRPSLEYAQYDFGITVTALAESPRPDVLSGEYNLTGTLFSEAIIAAKGGTRTIGYYVFIIGAGLLIGLNMALIVSSYLNQRPIMLSVATTYFIYVTLTWVNSGGLVIMFHIVTILGCLCSASMLKAIQLFYKKYFNLKAQSF